MKKICSLSVMLFALLGLFTACDNKDDITPAVTPDADIYIAGIDYYNSYQALVWKGTDLIYESPETIGLGAGMDYNSLFVRGNDIYGAGRVQGQAAIWKNGKATLLSIEGYPCGESGSGTSSVYVTPEGDVYVAGGICNNPALWINGELNILQGVEKGYAYSVFVHGKDVYVVGKSHLPNSRGQAILWKNGVLQVLSENILSIATQVQVAQNGDVYVLGGVENTHVYWIANKSEQVTIPLDGASSIYVKEDDVYVAGVIRGAAQYEFISAVWKKGKEVQYLTGSAQGNTAQSIVVSHNDNVYVVGTEEGNAVLWKNGTKHLLKENAEARSIVFKQ